MNAETRICTGNEDNPRVLAMIRPSGNRAMPYEMALCPALIDWREYKTRDEALLEAARLCGVDSWDVYMDPINCPDVLPCPFCGVIPDSTNYGSAIACDNLSCAARPCVQAPTKAAATRDWNHRAPCRRKAS